MGKRSVLLGLPALLLNPTDPGNGKPSWQCPRLPEACEGHTDERPEWTQPPRMKVGAGGTARRAPRLTAPAQPRLLPSGKDRVATDCTWLLGA